MDIESKRAFQDEQIVEPTSIGVDPNPAEMQTIPNDSSEIQLDLAKPAIFSPLEEAYKDGNEYNLVEKPRTTRAKMMLAEMTYPKTVDNFISEEVNEKNKKTGYDFEFYKFKNEKKSLISAFKIIEFRDRAQVMSDRLLEIEKSNPDDDSDALLGLYIQTQDLYTKWKEAVQEYLTDGNDRHIEIDFSLETEQALDSLKEQIDKKAEFVEMTNIEKENGRCLELSLYKSDKLGNPYGDKAELDIRVTHDKVIKQIDYMEVGDELGSLMDKIIDDGLPQDFIDRNQQNFIDASSGGLLSRYKSRGISLFHRNHDVGGYQKDFRVDTSQMSQPDIDTLLKTIIDATKQFLPKLAKVEENFEREKNDLFPIADQQPSIDKLIYDIGNKKNRYGPRFTKMFVNSVNEVDAEIAQYINSHLDEDGELSYETLGALLQLERIDKQRLIDSLIESTEMTKLLLELQTKVPELLPDLDPQRIADLSGPASVERILGAFPEGSLDAKTAIDILSTSYYGSGIEHILEHREVFNGLDVNVLPDVIIEAYEHKQPNSMLSAYFEIESHLEYFPLVNQQELANKIFQSGGV